MTPEEELNWYPSPETRLVALQDDLKKYLAGDYPNPRQHRPGKCQHGQFYWEQCETCNDNWIQAALDRSLIVKDK